MLDAALNSPGPLPAGSFILITDTLAASGQFLLHYFLRKHLASTPAARPHRNSDWLKDGAPNCWKRDLDGNGDGHRVCLIALSESISHYSSVAKKLGYSLSKCFESGQLSVIDLLSEPYDWHPHHKAFMAADVAGPGQIVKDASGMLIRHSDSAAQPSGLEYSTYSNQSLATVDAAVICEETSSTQVPIALPQAHLLGAQGRCSSSVAALTVEQPTSVAQLAAAGSRQSQSTDRSRFNASSQVNARGGGSSSHKKPSTTNIPERKEMGYSRDVDNALSGVTRFTFSVGDRMVDASSEEDRACSLQDQPFRVLLERLRKTLDVRHGKPNTSKDLISPITQGTCIVIDDVNLLRVAVGGSLDLVLEFLQYCRSFHIDGQPCTLVVLAHADINGDALTSYNVDGRQKTTVASLLQRQLEHWADVTISVNALSTGHAVDVHGQLRVTHTLRSRLLRKGHCSSTASVEPGLTLSSGNSDRVSCFQYRVIENGVRFFLAGGG